MNGTSEKEELNQKRSTALHPLNRLDYLDSRLQAAGNESKTDVASGQVKTEPVENFEETLMETDDEIHECLLCNGQYRTKSELEVHLQRSRCGRAKASHDLAPIDSDLNAQSKSFCYGCEICGKRFRRKDSLEKHLNSNCEREKKQSKYECEQCGRRFRSPSELTSHIRIHTGERPFPCDQCEKAFKTVSELRAHRVTHNEKVHKCHICERRFKRKGNLQAHVKVHSHDPVYLKYACEYCERRYPSRSKLTIHTRGHTGERPFKCEHCEWAFMSVSELNKHQVIHIQRNAYICGICNKGFTRSYNLKKHIQMHIGDPSNLNYVCEHCDRLFSSPSRLAEHVRTHTGEKPYKCNQCESTFSRLANLRCHIINSHIETAEADAESLVCEICNKRLKNKLTLRRHRRKVHMDKIDTMSQCSGCGHKFHKRIAYLKHIIECVEKTPENSETVGYSVNGDSVT